MAACAPSPSRNQEAPFTCARSDAGRDFIAHSSTACTVLASLSWPPPGRRSGRRTPPARRGWPRQRRRIEVDADADVAGKRRDQVLFQIEPGGLLHPVPQALRVGAGGAGELAPERLRRRGDAQVGGGAGRQARGEVGGRHQRLEGGHELVAGQVPELREHAHLHQLDFGLVHHPKAESPARRRAACRPRHRRARVEDASPVVPMCGSRGKSVSTRGLCRAAPRRPVRNDAEMVPPASLR